MVFGVNTNEAGEQTDDSGSTVGSGFQARTLDLVSKIPKGRVTTYKELARALGSPLASRAVGNAIAKNPRPVEIPCHRVVRSDGSVGKYIFGSDKKVSLLIEEGVEVKDGKVNLAKHLSRF
jgi:methylated-DNA-[protein]-cysteine S-methyltransferase